MTETAAPSIVDFIEGPADTWTLQVQVPTELVTQFEDVLVDDRGIVRCGDMNHGPFVLRQE